MSDYNPNDYRPGSALVRPWLGVAARWWALGCGVLVVLVVVGTIGKFALGWFSTGVAIISPANVTAQYADGYGRFADLKATACNVKQERGLVSGATDPSIQAQYQAQETAYEQNYRRIQALYDAAVQNIFAAKLVLPSDLPRTAPELESDITAYC